MKPIPKLIIAEIVAALALVAVLVLGQTATFTVPTTLPSGSTIGVTVTQTPAVVAAAPVTPPPVTPPPVTPPTPPTNPTAGPTTMPGPTNTGPVAGTVLTPYSGNLVVTTPGAVIKGLAVSGTINVEASNVTIINCTVDAGSELGINTDIYNAIEIHSNASNTTVENTSVTGTAGDGDAVVEDFGCGAVTFKNLKIYNTGSTAFFVNGGPTTIEGCYLYD